jgi:hypothetical protein
MGVLQVVPPLGIAGHADKPVAMNEELADVQRAIAGDTEAQEHLFGQHKD